MIPGFSAGATVNRRKFVKISAAFTVIQCVAGDVAIGVSGSGARDTPIPNGSTAAALTGDPVKVHSLGEVVPMDGGGAITAGDFVKPDANGDPVVCTAGDKYSGQAMNTQATAGSEVLILVCRGVA